MRKARDQCAARIIKKNSTKVAEPKKKFGEELTVVPSEECDLHSSLDRDGHESDESEEESIKEGEEVPEEEAIEELEEDLEEEESLKDLDSDGHENYETEEESIKEAEGDAKEELIEELKEVFEEESTEDLDSDGHENYEEEEESIKEAEEEPKEESIEELEEILEEESMGDTDEDPEEESREELEEVFEEESTEDLDSDGHENYEPEEESNKEAEEEPKEESIKELEEVLEEESIADMEEEPDEGSSEELEDGSEEEASRELENDPEEELEVEPTMELSQCGFQTLSNWDGDPKQFMEEHKEETVSKVSSEIAVDEDKHQSPSVLNNSSEKKRSLDAAGGESNPLQTYPSRKKFRQVESSKEGSDVEFTFADLSTDSGVSEAVTDEGAYKQKEGTGSSGKRRRGRWHTQLEGDSETCVGDRTNKRRKTRWDIDDKELKMLGPIQLPNFKKEFPDAFDFDIEIQELKARLIEINSKLKSSELHDDRPQDERPPSPQPVYNNLGIIVNTREVRLREKLFRERQTIISSLIQKNPSFKAPSDYKPPKHAKKLYIPVNEYPNFNFIGLILGPRGNTQKEMEKKTGAKISLRGKGSSKTPKKADSSDNDDLHVLIEADNQKSLDAAMAMVDNLLNPFNAMTKEHKLTQLKELAKLKGTYIDENTCKACGDQGHQQYACPSSSSTFDFGVTSGNSHRSTGCPSIALSPAPNNMGSSSGVGSIPKSNREIDDANLYVGYLPQEVDDNRLSELFTPFGKLEKAKVIKDRTTGLSKGYGFVKFEDSSDAAAAVMHMNGFKMDGKVLAVRVAGFPLAPVYSVMSHPPVMYPGPAIVSSNVPGQIAMLPSSLYLEHGFLLPQNEDLGFSTPSNVSSFPGSMSRTGFISNYKCSDQIQFSSPSSLAQFPGDPNYSGSQFQSYFTTPETQAFPWTNPIPTPENYLLKPMSLPVNKFPQ